MADRENLLPVRKVMVAAFVHEQTGLRILQTWMAGNELSWKGLSGLVGDELGRDPVARQVLWRGVQRNLEEETNEALKRLTSFDFNARSAKLRKRAK